jgi:hypothetical protein
MVTGLRLTGMTDTLGTSETCHYHGRKASLTQ